MTRRSRHYPRELRERAVRMVAEVAAIAHNLTRAASTLASLFHATARTGTLRQHLINVPARIARRSRHITLRLPANWPHTAAFHGLFTASPAPPGPIKAPTVEK